MDSEVYTDREINTHVPPNNGGNSLEINIPQDVTVVIKSINMHRPVISLKKSLIIRGERGSRIFLDGLLFSLSEETQNSSNNPSLYESNSTILKIDKGDLLELTITHCTLVPARNNNENNGRLVFSWENIPQSSNDVARLKLFLSDLINEEWIKGNNLILSKEGLEDNLITISTPDRAVPPLRLLLNLKSGTDSNNKESATSAVEVQELVETRPLSQNEYKTIYKLPVIQQNGLTKAFSSRYSIGIFGNSADALNDNNSTPTTNATPDNGNDKRNSSLVVSIDKSIIGRIDSLSSFASVKIVNSIIEGKGVIEAIRSFLIHIESSTVFGKTSSEILDFCSNSIFTDILDIQRRQQGCLRFCFVPHLSQTPRPFRCVLEYQKIHPMVNLDNKYGEGSSNPRLTNLRPFRIKPQFTSVFYGDDGYGQLHKDVHKLIFEGGDNGSEMGVFNSLHNPQRLRNLSSSLGEYLKFGLEAGIFWVT